jgi:two-component system, OmpR family, phosphate regulon sensor histidine kinase PhoR
VHDETAGGSYEELRASFTAAVSHDLRTPLARVLALLETALLPGTDPRQLVEQAREEVEQISELVDDVLFLSELETGREVVSLGSTRVEPIVRDVAEQLGERAERADVALTFQVEEGLELPLRPRMLRMVVENLVENAVRYAGPRASFALTAGHENGTVVISAVDDGAGVPDEELLRLFERFYRGDRVRASRGTGLGLAIVKHVVNAAGGSVEALRSSGGGLEVRCVFPS